MIFPWSSYETRTRSILPADLSCLALSLTSVSDDHFAFFGKKKSAPASAIIQFSRNLMGHVTAIPSSPALMLHVPRGSFALSFVQFGTLLLNGQSFLSRCRVASGEKLS